MPNFQVIFHSKNTPLIDHSGGLDLVKFLQKHAEFKHTLDDINVVPRHLVIHEAVLVIHDPELILENEHLSEIFKCNYSAVITVSDTIKPILNNYVDFKIIQENKKDIRLEMFFNKNKFFEDWVKAGCPLDTKWLLDTANTPTDTVDEQVLELLDQLAEVVNTFLPNTGAEEEVFVKIYELLSKYNYGDGYAHEA